MVTDRTPVSITIGHLPLGIAGPARLALQCDALPRLRESFSVPDNQEMQETALGAPRKIPVADYRLRKHADYQRVYREGRKQFSSSMSYFFALRPQAATSGPRVGLTAGKVLGNAVERNRIKRRMRDIVRRRVALVHADVDIVLHPRKLVLTMDFAKLENEVTRLFSSIQAAIDKQPVAGNAELKGAS